MFAGIKVTHCAISVCVWGLNHHSSHNLNNNKLSVMWLHCERWFLGFNPRTNSRAGSGDGCRWTSAATTSSLVAAPIPLRPSSRRFTAAVREQCPSHADDIAGCQWYMTRWDSKCCLHLQLDYTRRTAASSWEVTVWKHKRKTLTASDASGISL